MEAKNKTQLVVGNIYYLDSDKDCYGKLVEIRSNGLDFTDVVDNKGYVETKPGIIGFADFDVYPY